MTTDRGPWTWAFPLGMSEKPRLLTDDEILGEGSVPDDCNIATMFRVEDVPDHYFRIVLEGSYERLTLELTCATKEQAAEVYADLLQRSGEYQG
jgi:hypothetical protein